MNHHDTSLEPDAQPTPHGPAGDTHGREAYATPRLTRYGRMQRLTGSANSVAGPDGEIAIGEGAL